MNPESKPGAGEAFGFLAGGGEMGWRIRAFDWSKTPLGPVEEWPQSLRSAVSICLPSKAQIILCWGPDLITLYNDGYRPVFGAKHPHVLGLPVREAWREVWAQGLKGFFEGVLSTGEAFWAKDLPFSLERFGYPEEAFFDVSYDPVRDESGQVGGIFCIVNETTGRVVSARRVRTLRELGTRTADAKSALDVFRVSSDVLADNPHDVPFAFFYVDGQPSTAGAPPSELWPLAEASATGQPVVIEQLTAALGSLPGGPWPEPAQSAVVLPIVRAGGGAPHGFIVAGISPRRRIDADYLTFLNLVASQIAAALANVLAYEEERTRAEALAEIDRAKNVFFSNVSHEFRTPLALILGPLQETLDSAPGSLPPEAEAALKVAHRNSLRLLKLVNTLLDFARLEAGRVDATYEPTDLATLTAELASVFRSAIEKAGVRLTVDCPPMSTEAYVDPDMWEKIVLNLLSNAFKFTFEGEIVVVLRCLGDRFELSVRDTGVGIPSADVPKMFQRFHRVRNSRSRTHEGTGIGLAFVQELVKLHGGEVTVESEEGRGSTFTVSIPTGHSHLPAARRGADRSVASTRVGPAPFVEEALRWLPSSKDDGADVPDRPSLAELAEAFPGRDPASIAERGRILLADDNADMREYLSRLLTHQFDVVSVADGEAALEQARTHTPDLLLTDVMMSRMDGFSLVRAIRADPHLRTLPVIMLSARAGEESRIEGLAAGADDYLIKPFSARDLLARITSQLALARVRQEAARALRYRSDQYETLLNQAPLGVYLVDADFRIRDVNPVALPVFGDIPGGIVGRDFDEIIHILWDKRFADEIVRIFRHTLDTGEPYVARERAEFRIDRGVTEYYEWRLERITLPDGDYGVVCYFRDISDRVEARLLLERQAKALEDANRTKDEFLAMLGHEMRNPLAPIVTALQVMQLRGEQSREQEIIERQVGHIRRLVDDLLDVSRITRGTIELRTQPVEVAEAVLRAVETVSPLLDQREHQLLLDVPRDGLKVMGDIQRLAQSLSNLLANASKYSEIGRTITVKAWRAGDTVEISVKDEGIGIAPDMQERIFELFVQEPQSSNRSAGGLGLGLAIVRTLIRMHGGAVRVESAGLGQGSEFIVSLPALGPYALPATAPPSARSQSLPGVGQRVLVVDDNGDAGATLKALLEAVGYRVVVVHDGPAALREASTFEPQIALLDIGLPGMDGYELAQRLRERYRGPLKLVAVTGYGLQTDKDRALIAGFDDHLTKPVDLETLNRILQPPTRD